MEATLSKTGARISATASRLVRHGTARPMGTVGKGANRAAVDGSRSPVTNTVNMEEVEEAIEKGKEEKQKKSEEVEKKVDSNIKSSQNSN